MQFLISVIDDRTGSATPAEMAVIDAFNARLVAAGHWVFAGGLTAPDAAVLIDGRVDPPNHIPGTLATSHDYLSGCWIITAPDLDTARALAADASRACHRRVELRPFLGA
ncbi:MAG: hypothetical protein RL238_677 [Actinomycetota bacterium]|jgi:hypothetical protein